MQTKEINIWVNSAIINDENPNCYGLYSSPAKLKLADGEREKAIKAKLIIEIPERRKEFTESEIRNAVARELGYYKETGRIIESLFKD